MTVLQKSWSSGSWKTSPTRRRTSGAFRSFDLRGRRSRRSARPSAGLRSHPKQPCAHARSCRAPSPATGRSSAGGACSCPRRWDRPPRPTRRARRQIDAPQGVLSVGIAILQAAAHGSPVRLDRLGGRHGGRLDAEIPRGEFSFGQRAVHSSRLRIALASRGRSWRRELARRVRMNAKKACRSGP